MADGTASWHFFDVESGLVPEECRSSILPGGGEGRIVVFAATPFACANEWASRAVAAVAHAWAEEGRRIFLMDLSLDHPCLHEALGLPNQEGVSDAFLYGASVQHIAQSAMDGALFFASAGTVTADPEEVLTHPRWNDLAGGFSEADATLILFLPTDIPGADRILSLASDLVFLAGEGESLESHVGPAAIKLVATLGPMGAAEAEATPSAPGSVHEAVVGGEDELTDRFDLAPDFPTHELSAGTDREPAGEEADDSGASKEAVVIGGDQRLDEGVVGGSGPGVPDFAADFAELPPLESEAPASEDLGRGSAGFGDDLVQGSDFGVSMMPPSAEEEDVTGMEPGSRASGRPAPGVVEDAGGEGGGTPPGGGEAHAEPEGGGERDAGRARGTTRQPLAAERARPAPKRRSPPAKKRPIGLLLGAGALVVLLVAAALGTATGLVRVPGFSFLEGMVGDLPDPPLNLAGPQPNEPVLRYSLELFRYQEGELEMAVEMRDALRARLPDLLFALVPEMAGEERTWTVLAGPATDFIEVENLRGPLGETLTREDPDTWPVRQTPRGFYLGERGTLGEAQDYAASVEGDGLFAYILHVTYPDATEAYEILSGAYEGIQDARPLQRILSQHGFRDAPLIERRGRLPE